MENSYDIIIIGASFAGLTLAHHLPKSKKVLIIEVKPEAGATVESTGLITSHTRDEFATFFDIDTYITNPIKSICVVAPGYKDHFISNTKAPWIYQTDTRTLVNNLANTLPDNVHLATKTVFTGININQSNSVISIEVKSNGEARQIQTKFLVGADGSRSKVASLVPHLSQNKKFLFGYEQVHYGKVLLGPKPEETIYHFWFGDFSLGYGGWLSPSIENGRPAFRIGLAKKMKQRGEAKQLLIKFMDRLLEEKIISIDEAIDKPSFTFGSIIPISPVGTSLVADNTLLVGDAAGFCGAFAADGIKGAIISGKVAAKLITEHSTNGEPLSHSEYISEMNSYNKLINYYRRQLLYRWVWDLMKSNRTFTAMYKIIRSEQDSFLNQFCDSKDKHKSLSRTVLKVRYIPKLIKYSSFIVLDLFKPIKK